MSKEAGSDQIRYYWQHSHKGWETQEEGTKIYDQDEEPSENTGQDGQTTREKRR
jgi:hypothetical protein